MSAVAEIERRRRVAVAVAEAPPVEEILEDDSKDILEWAPRRFYVPEPTVGLIDLRPFQAAVLRCALQRSVEGYLRWRTAVWSQVKKAGKTAISGCVGRHAAETWGDFQEVLFVGNDGDQAKERGFASAMHSIELTPGYHRGLRELGGRWRVRDKEMTNLRNGSRMKAISADYQGEAGASPSLTIWTELWGFIHKDALRFWAEMAPSPTRMNSMRWIETYAGYEGESELLWGLYESTVKNGRQLRVRDLEALFDSAELAALLADGPLFEEAPDLDDLIPCYVNDRAETFAFWDDGVAARRMPWQQGERGASYYANEAATQTASQMIRLHENRWVSAESAFVPIEWFDACGPPTREILPMPGAGDRTPLVVILDAAVTGDSFGLTVMSRDPDRPKDGVALRMSRKWEPPKGGSIDYAGPEAVLRELCKSFNVVQCGYDPYQLHDFATRMTKERVCWMRPFPQGQDRLRADKGLYDLIRDRRFRHNGDPDVREHVANANAKLQKDADSQLRIVKKSESRKIDLCVCLSMGASECLRLNL